jgi:hypothetical protein
MKIRAIEIQNEDNRGIVVKECGDSKLFLSVLGDYAEFNNSELNELIDAIETLRPHLITNYKENQL